MLLTIDVGNSNIVFGLFKDDILKKKARFGTSPKALRAELLKIKDLFIEGVMVSSVVPELDSLLKRTIIDIFRINPYFVSNHTFKKIMPLRMPKPAEVGADRLVDAYAAKQLYGKPSVVVDFGTATTFCAVNGRGEYLGGAICPGVAVSRDSLHEKTAKLPLVDLKFPGRAIGGDTVSAMKSGLLFGYIGIVEGMVERFRKEMGGRPRVIATGGLAGIIAKGTDIIDIVDPGLTLKGLQMIWGRIWQTK